MQTLSRLSTTEMEVTSIRLERELKERLKELSGNRGYQALIRDILWNYIETKSANFQPQVATAEIRATFPAIAQQAQRCMLTGKSIQPLEPILLGLTSAGQLVTLSSDSVS